MQLKLRNLLNKKLLFKTILTFPLLLTFYPVFVKSTKAAIEFQWNGDENYKQLKWHQKNPTKMAKNKIFFFLRPSDRNTGLIKIYIKIPDNFKSTLKTKNINLCEVNVGGFDSRTKCLKNIPSDIEITNGGKNIDIYPLAPVPSSKDSYAVVFKIVNPQKAGLYQFHSFGKSSGTIPVSSYIGSWTIKINQL
tara:strand:- start:135 stop:710 length:576 start_codon:yes stop_codon:yes gene_type:complete